MADNLFTIPKYSFSNHHQIFFFFARFSNSQKYFFIFKFFNFMIFIFFGHQKNSISNFLFPTICCLNYPIAFNRSKSLFLTI